MAASYSHSLVHKLDELMKISVRGLPTDHRIEQMRDLQATGGSDGHREALEQGVLEKYHWRQPRRGCRGHPLQYFGWGDVNGFIPANIITYFWI